MQILVHIGLLDSFRIEHVPNDIEKFIEDKNIKANIFRIYFECKHFCIGFIDFMFAGKTLTDYTILFFAYDFKSMVLWF